MAHKTHIKCTISVLMVNFQQKISLWLISNVSIIIFSQNYFFDSQHVDLAPQEDSREVAALSWPRSRSTARWQSAPGMDIIFSRQSSIGSCQILEGCAEFLKKLTGRMPGRCFCYYFCMLPHLQIEFGKDLGRGLCAWQCKYSACQQITKNSLNL